MNVKKLREEHEAPGHDHQGCDICQLVAEVGFLNRAIDMVRGREDKLHYAIRTTANILDKKRADESQAECLKLVAKMHAVWEAAHDVDKAYSRNEQHPGERDGALERMRVVLDAPVSSFGPE